MDTDTELFLAVKKGDDQAFSRLFQKYFPKILNLIYRFVSDPQHAEDIAQEVFVRVYSGAKTFSPQSKFSTWLYKVTINRCFSDYKKTRREKERQVTESDLATDGQRDPLTLENHPSPQPSPEAQVINTELQQSIQSALDKLPPDQKMALVLLTYEGLSYEEIARISGSSIKAVERRIYHARQTLRTLLADHISP